MLRQFGPIHHQIDTLQEPSSSPQQLPSLTSAPSIAHQTLPSSVCMVENSSITPNRCPLSYFILLSFSSLCLQLNPGPLTFSFTKVNDKYIKCFIDGGAQVTIIDTNVATELNISAASSEQLRTKDWKQCQSIDTVTISDPVSFRSDFGQITTPVILRPNEGQISLGNDVNIPLRYVTANIRTHLDDSKFSSLLSSSPSIPLSADEPTPNEIHNDTRIRAAVADLLEINKNIPNDAKCTLPYAVVTIDLFDHASPQFRKQYKVRYHYYLVF